MFDGHSKNGHFSAMNAAIADIDIGALITRTPGIKSGTPHIAGTGVTVRTIVRYYKLGLSPEEIAAEYRWAATAGHWRVQSPGGAASARRGGSIGTRRLHGPSGGPDAEPGSPGPAHPTKSATSPKCPGGGVRAPATTSPAGCPRLYRPGAGGRPVRRCGRRRARSGRVWRRAGWRRWAAVLWGPERRVFFCRP